MNKITFYLNKLKINDREVDAIFFFNPEEPYGFLSNWYPASFELDGLKFCSTEQYIMYRKAVTLGDTEIAEAILATDSMGEQQALGRKVRGYNAFLWEGQRQVAALRGIYAKFSQNEDLKEKLLATGDSWLVECYEKDKVWSCGWGQTDPRRLDTALWSGYSILGSALMEVREMLK